MDELDVYVLGAGASAAHGAPVTDKILPYVFDRLAGDERLAPASELLADLFACDTGNADSRFPSLVDVLSVVDMAIDRGDRFAAGYDPDRLREARGALEYAIFRALEMALRYSDKSCGATRQLAATLDACCSAVLSLNYDVIIDRAIAFRTEDDDTGDVERGFVPEPDAAAIDYGVEFANAGPVDGERITLLKLHGSFNWLESSVTGDLYLGGMAKEVERLYDDALHVYLRDLRTGSEITLPRAELRPLMITPTHLKDMRNPHVAAIWRRAASVVRRARRLTFVGYSLPGDDIHVKYLFKRALVTRPEGPLPEIVVVNPDPAVLDNYERFFGDVSEHHVGFEAFAAGLSGRGG